MGLPLGDNFVTTSSTLVDRHNYKLPNSELGPKKALFRIDFFTKYCFPNLRWIHVKALEVEDYEFVAVHHHHLMWSPMWRCAASQEEPLLPTGAPTSLRKATLASQRTLAGLHWLGWSFWSCWRCFLFRNYVAGLVGEIWQEGEEGEPGAQGGRRFSLIAWYHFAR